MENPASERKKAVQAADSELRVSAQAHLVMAAGSETAASCCPEQKTVPDGVCTGGVQYGNWKVTVSLSTTPALRDLLCAVSVWGLTVPSPENAQFAKEKVRSYKDRIKIACLNCSTRTRRGRLMSRPR